MSPAQMKRVAKARALRAAGVSATKVAARLGVSRTTVSRWCRGMGPQPLQLRQAQRRLREREHADGCDCSFGCEMVAFRKRSLELRIQRIAASYPEKEIAA